MAKVTKYYLVLQESIVNGARAKGGERVAIVVDEDTWKAGPNLLEITQAQMDPKVPVDVPGEPPKPEKAAAVAAKASGEIARLTWRNGTVTADTLEPHGLTATPANLIIAGASREGYNGRFACTPTGPSAFTYSLAPDPGGSATGARFVVD